jgi:hypothetical protein
MKFAAPRRRNPFDNPLLGLSMHLSVVAASVVAAYFALANATLMPLYGVLAFVTVVEGMWLFFHIRR